MTLTAKSFAIALALAAMPAATLADGRDHDRGPVTPAPSPYPGERHDRPDRDDGWQDRDDGWQDRDGRWQVRDDRWQDRDGRWQRDPDDRFDRFSRWDRGPGYRVAYWHRADWRDLRRDFWELERQRDAFYASGWHRPREVRRFERWYAFRRAELERRREALTAYAYARR